MAKKFPYYYKIPKEVLLLNPRHDAKEIRLIIRTIFNNKNHILRQSSKFEVPLKGVCTLRTHGNKKVSYVKQLRRKDKIKKRRKQRKLGLTKERLLW